MSRRFAVLLAAAIGLTPGRPIGQADAFFLSQQPLVEPPPHLEGKQSIDESLSALVATFK